MKCALLFPQRVVAVLFVWLSGLGAMEQLLADTFEIRGLGTITGKLLNEPGSSVLKILTNDGVELEIASGKLRPPVIVPAEKEKAYLASFLGKQDSVELHRALSKDCLDSKALSYAHRERVVELDSSHENWIALGDMTFDKRSGEYIKSDVAFKRKGMVHLGGRIWETPQSHAIEKLDDSQKKEVGETRTSIKNNLQNLNDRGPKQAKAIEFFGNLKTPAAIEVIYLDYFKKDNFGQAEVFMPILARMPGNAASHVFVYLAMNSKNQELVRVSLELLSREQCREYAMNAFLNVIRDPKTLPDTVDRAGTHIQSFPDKVAIPDLIERLISIIKTTTSIPGENTFNRDGSGGGISTPRTLKQDRIHNHQPVLTALIALSDGANYNYDIPQWRIWYANTYSKSNLDLRRNE